MLFTYMRRVQRYLKDQRVQIIPPADLIDFINEARGQLAGEAECLPVLASIALQPNVQVYPFSSIVLPSTGIPLIDSGGNYLLDSTGNTLYSSGGGGTMNGLGGILNVRTLWYSVGQGQKWIRPRPWPWFTLYELNNPVPTLGPPQKWAQYGQGNAGTIYISPVPDIGYIVPVDCVAYPVPLVDDTTIEAIPYLWTDAVPYYAAYLAMLSQQSGGATAEADKMFERYQKYVQRAREGATSSVLPTLYSQVPSPVRANQLGMQSQGRN
jgi:hypothetical protein